MEKGDSTTKQQRVSKLKATVYSCSQDFFSRYDYTSIRILGKGMMGQVVLAQPPKSSSNQQLEAVKTFTKKTEDGGNRNKKLFIQEVAILQSIKHKCIMGDVKAFDCPDEYVMCMPYYKEGSLKQHLSSMTIGLVDKYMLQLTSAVLYLHTHHLAHRDIKPDNVLVSDEGNVILTDFGLACVVKSKSMSGVWRCGSNGYIAPELDESKSRKIDLYKCDMYSLGVVLWNMIFRRVRAPASLGYLSFIRAQPHIPGSYKQVVEKLLHQDPNMRWDSDKLVSTLSKWPSMVKLMKTF